MQAMLAATRRQRQRALLAQSWAIRAAVWAEGKDFERFTQALSGGPGGQKAGHEAVADADALIAAWGGGR